MKQVVAPVTFRPADPEDLKVNNKEMRIGQAYLVLNKENQKLSGFHIIDQETNAHQLAYWFKNDQLYVPVSCLDSEIRITEINQNQIAS